MSMVDEQYDAGPPQAPHGLLLAVVVGLLVVWPLFLGRGGEAVTDAIANAIAEMLGPVGLLLLPVGLLLLIHLLSSDAAPDALHHVAGSPIGVALMLVLILAFLYYRSALFRSGGDDDE
ncbi:unnamed protein product [Triticum turgidum subsp. durum]|uniref:Uncharacterized protein n=1 Tax=Triticum turgidum subsp. durum TaxID=4567 RepID=A0A9R1Q3E2_TRITD|nr:unnamed protein product [Triticum turgidum subsp. durum]